MTILKLTTFSCKLLLQITLLLAKYDFLNTYTAASAEMKHYLLYNIIAEVGSGSL